MRTYPLLGGMRVARGAANVVELWERPRIMVDVSAWLVLNYFPAAADRRLDLVLSQLERRRGETGDLGIDDP